MSRSATIAPGRFSPLALALVCAITFLWGLNWPAMRFVVRELDPWTFRVISVFGAGASLLLLARLSGERLGLRREIIRPLVLLSLVNITGWHILSAYGVLLLGGGRAAILAFTMPVWAAILSVAVLKEAFGVRQFLALLLGIGGIASLMAPDFVRLGSVPLGAFVMVGAAMCWAIGTIGIKLREWKMGVLALTGWQLIIGGVPILLAWLVIVPEPDLSRLTPQGLIALAYVVFVALVFCFTSYIKLVTLLPANIAAISVLAIPVVGLLSSAMLLGEPVGVAEISALGMVLSALALVLLRPPARSR